MSDKNYADDVKKYAADLNDDAVKGIVRHCGIALRSKDASLVSCSQKSELDRVKQSFLQKKLGLTDDAAMDKAIEEVCVTMGKSNPNKSRVTFYYLLAEKFGKLSDFG